MKIGNDTTFGTEREGRRDKLFSPEYSTTTTQAKQKCLRIAAPSSDKTANLLLQKALAYH
jgi:hypothetical protein